MEPVKVVIYSIGTDDCRVSLDIAQNCLKAGLEKWHDRSCFQVALVYDEAERADSTFRELQGSLASFLKDLQVDVVREDDVDWSEVRGVGVGAIRALRRGGDLANVKLHRRYPDLDGLIRSQYHNTIGQLGQAYPVAMSGNAPLELVVLAISPNMNEKRAECMRDSGQVAKLLESAYSNMFQLFSESLLAHHKRARTSEDLSIRAIGLGTLPLGVKYPDPEARPSQEQVMELLEKTVFASPHVATPMLIDLADTYCSGPMDLHYIERVVGRLLVKNALVKTKLWIATKSGMKRVNEQSNGWRVRLDFGPKQVRETVQSSLRNLGLESIPLWQLHHADAIFKKNPTQLKQIVDEAVELQRLGWIQHIGLCNCNPHVLEWAKETHIPLYAVQQEYNYWNRESESNGVFRLCKEMDLLVIIHSPLGGLGARRNDRSFERSMPLVTTIGMNKSCSPVQVYLQYLYYRVHNVLGVKRVVLIPSGRSLERVVQAQRANEVQLTEAECNALDELWSRT